MLIMGWSWPSNACEGHGQWANVRYVPLVPMSIPRVDPGFRMPLVVLAQSPRHEASHPCSHRDEECGKAENQESDSAGHSWMTKSKKRPLTDHHQRRIKKVVAVNTSWNQLTILFCQVPAVK